MNTWPTQLHFAQFFVAANYRLGREREASRYFDHPEQAYLALREPARKRGIPFFLIDFQFHQELSDSFRNEQRIEATDRYLDWMVLNQRMPRSERDFGSAPGQLNLIHNRFFGVGTYRPDADYRASRYFDNREEAVRALQSRAIERGLPLNLIDILDK